jgi:POT family proton-dependent oligopeptide transporter
VGGQVLDPAAALATSMKGFTQLGWAGVGVGVVFVALSFFIKHWSHGANDPVRAQPEPIAPVLDGERQAVSPAAIRADRES